MSAQQPTEATPQRRWWAFVAGVALVGSAVLAWVTRWDAIVHAHPAYPVTLLAAAVVGALLIVVWTRGRHSESSTARTVGGIAVVVLAILAGAAVWLLRPVSATAVAVAALDDGHGVQIAESRTHIEMRPSGLPERSGIAFYPGGLVDPRAYANVLRPLAEAGHPVVIIKPPFGIAFLATNDAVSIAENTPELSWVVAGHSLGGVAAAGAVAGSQALDGLALWASFPAESIADQTSLDVTSVFGTNDGLTTPDDVAESQADLPPQTTFVPVDGAVHAHFGDYGPQRGDGVPGVSRKVAQDEILTATLQLLQRLAVTVR